MEGMRNIMHGMCSCIRQSASCSVIQIGTCEPLPKRWGVAKTLKLALRLKEFRDKLKAEGRDTYTMGEEYEYIKDILDT